jgi:hypothetical protein
MGLFSRKNQEPRRSRAHERPVPGRLDLPPVRRRIPDITSREYRIFRGQKQGRLHWYEKFCALSLKFIKVEPGGAMKEKLAAAINFTGLRVTPAGVMSFALLSFLAFLMAGVAVVPVVKTPVAAMLVIAAGAGFFYFIFKYPENFAKTMRIRASSQVVLAILYMVISMRISPNVERALRFTAANISGELAWDMRKLLWDIEMGTYHSANEALTDYIAKWKYENEEFAESLRLIRDSQSQVYEKAKQDLDQALEVILEGTKTRMKHYAQDLRTPVMVIHMMGIVLPVMGTIIAPMAAVFLADMVNAWHFIIGYDIALPIFIMWFINMTLQKRPATFSQIDTSNHPDLPPEGSFFMKTGKGRTAFPAMPLALILALVLMTPSVYYFVENPQFLFNAAVPDENPLLTLVMSSMIVVGAGLSLSAYFILTSFQSIKVQKNIQSSESEFELALFQLGNRISGGTPTELALDRALDDVKDLKISGLFRMCINNIRNLGMTFGESLFHPKWGALRYYPSKLIRNIMLTVVDTSKRGVRYASEAMLTISHYLKNMKETQEYLRDILSETVSSMKFQAYVLTPMITGLIAAMAQIIIRVLVFLGLRLNDMGFGEYFGMTNSMNLFGNIEAAISPALFQLIVGVYLLEVIMILAMFLTKISYGENRIIQRDAMGKMLIVGLVMYFIVAVASSAVFGNLITGAVESIGAE